MKNVLSLKQNIKFIGKDKNVFFITLNKRIDSYFKEKGISKHANFLMVSKTIILLSMYIIPFVCILVYKPSFPVSLICWAICGFGMAGVGMSIMHDGNHEGYSKSKFVNKLMGYTINLCGASAFNWKIQHNVMHHTFTNISGLDEDIEDKPPLRFSPHTTVKEYHKWQVVYAFLFYGILTLYWVLLKDLIQFIKYIKNGVNTNTNSQNALVFFKISIIKICYFFIVIFLPIFILDISVWQVFFGFLLMHFISGIILTTTFQLAHTVDGTSHPMPDEHGNIDNDWAVHQLNTTINFSRKSKVLNWYLGGLNFQVEHHLFPRISHVHYPAISKIVKATAEEFGVPYLENKTLMDALKGHLVALKKLGRLPNINDAIAG